MLIRRLRTEEYDALGQITIAAYRHLEKVSYLGPYEEELVAVARRDLDSEVFVALGDDSTLLGGVTYVPDATRHMSEFDDPEGAGIRMLAVDPAHQGHGAGRALVERCVERAREDRRGRIILHSTPVMVRAQALYESLGFERAPVLDVTFSEEPFSPSEPLLLIAYVLEL